MNAAPPDTVRADKIGLAYLLTHLDGVKQVARGWRARCPNCGGSTLKLAISIGGGGAELQCWGGCTEQAVLEAVHADARAPRAVDGAPRTGFDAILFETCIAWIAAGEVMEGKPISLESFERLRLARVRLRREIARMKALLREHQKTGGAP